MPSWPATLPRRFEQRGYQQALPDTVLRTSVESGPDKRRRRFTAAPRPLSGSMFLTSAQIGELETFHEGSIGGGALAFDFPDPFDSTVTLSVAFLDPPSWSNVGGDLYSVRLNLEVLP